MNSGRSDENVSVHTFTLTNKSLTVCHNSNKFNISATQSLHELRGERRVCRLPVGQRRKSMPNEPASLMRIIIIYYWN